MKKFFFALFVISFSMGAVSAESIAPKDAKQQRLERRSEAYNKSLNQAVKDLKGTGCYYSTEGCSKQQLAKPGGFQKDAGRKNLNYPRKGYVLQTDGTYKFKPGGQSQN